MEHDDLVARFAAFCGEERFLLFMFKLTMTCPYKGRLLFWQQDLWEAFVAEQGQDIPTAYEDVVALLGQCPIHRCSFLPDRVRAVEQVQWASDYCEAERERFPFPNHFFYGSRPKPVRTSPVEVAYCPECRREEQAWLEKNDPFGNAVQITKWREPR